jgi:hypothetical protein
VFLALRRELVRRDKAKARAEALAARRAQQSSMEEGARSRRRRRAWATRPRA